MPKKDDGVIELDTSKAKKSLRSANNAAPVSKRIVNNPDQLSKSSQLAQSKTLKSVPSKESQAKTTKSQPKAASLNSIDFDNEVEVIQHKKARKSPYFIDTGKRNAKQRAEESDSADEDVESDDREDSDASDRDDNDVELYEDMDDFEYNEDDDDSGDDDLDEDGFSGSDGEEDDSELDFDEQDKRDVESVSSESNMSMTPEERRQMRESLVAKYEAASGRKLRVKPNKPINLAAYSDSEDEEMPNRIGNVPLHWYDEEDHIGYDIYGNKIMRKDRGDSIDAFLARTDDPNAGRTVYDRYNDEKIVLTDEELSMINRIRKGKFPDRAFDPYDDDIINNVTPHIGILSNPQVPKSRFIPSKWEAMKVVKFIHKLRNGWIRDPNLPPLPKKKERTFDIWGSSRDVPTRSLIPPPKIKLPGHAESFNPPEEYLWTEDEKKHQLSLPLHKREYDFIPKKYNSLREVEAYTNIIIENHSRCLDLYMAVRGQVTKRKGPSLRQKFERLPKPRDLRPFPTTFSLEYIGHKGMVRGVDVSPSGQWLVSGSDDGTVRLWEVSTARCAKVWNLQEKVISVAWNPNPELPMVAAGVDTGLVVLGTGTGTVEENNHVESLLKTAPFVARKAARENLAAKLRSATKSGGNELKQSLLEKRIRWLSWHHRQLLLDAPERFIEAQMKYDEEEMRRAEEDYEKYVQGKQLDEEADLHNEYVEGDLQDDKVEGLPRLFIYIEFGACDIHWHHKGDYISTVSPVSSSTSVAIHRLSLAATQFPFKSSSGSVQRARFHPILPHFYVATQTKVQIYNLATRKRKNALVGGSSYLSTLAIHPRGEHVLVGGYDSRAAWYDTELSDKPFRSMRYHRKAVRSVAFHPKFPLFATASDDGFVHIQHCTVYNDYVTDPLIVPLKIIHAHIPQDGFGVMDIVFHPIQPWIFTCATDSTIRLFS